MSYEILSHLVQFSTVICGMLFVIFYSYLGTAKLLYASAFIMGISAWIATLSALSPFKITKGVPQRA